jgi:hypothetical protein
MHHNVTLGPAVHHYVRLGRKVHQWRISPEAFGRVSPTKRHENHCFHAHVTLGNGCRLVRLAFDQNNALLTDAFRPQSEQSVIHFMVEL